jgi:hypothetical protein
LLHTFNQCTPIDVSAEILRINNRSIRRIRRTQKKPSPALRYEERDHAGKTGIMRTLGKVYEHGSKFYIGCGHTVATSKKRADLTH